MLFSPSPQRTRWYAIGPRVLFFTLLVTLLCFAITLLFSILWIVIGAAIHGAPPDFRFAYRNVALPVAAVASVVAFLFALVTEVRHYRQTKALAGIARASQ
jgi:TRAP-type C4-dicarboxylate transport system permease small subunit